MLHSEQYSTHSCVAQQLNLLYKLLAHFYEVPLWWQMTMTRWNMLEPATVSRKMYFQHLAAFQTRGTTNFVAFSTLIQNSKQQPVGNARLLSSGAIRCDIHGIHGVQMHMAYMPWWRKVHDSTKIPDRLETESCSFAVLAGVQGDQLSCTCEPGHVLNLPCFTMHFKARPKHRCQVLALLIHQLCIRQNLRILVPSGTRRVSRLDSFNSVTTQMEAL